MRGRWAVEGRGSDERGESHGGVICRILVLEAPELATAQSLGEGERGGEMV